MNDLFLGSLFIILIIGFLFTIIPWLFSFIYEGIVILIESLEYGKSFKKPKTRKVTK
jgi:hypothetical protein